MNTPLVSVLMPAYNAEKFIAEAIESILNQTFKDFEFIIVDDCSTDSTWEIIQRYSQKDSRIIGVRNEENLYIAKALNKGMQYTSSNFIARMDADDISLPNRIDQQFNLINSNKQIAVVGGNIILIDESGQKIGNRTYPVGDREIKARMFKHSPFAHPATMFRKDSFVEFSGYNSRWSPSEDIDLWFKIGTKYQFANIPNNVLKYRYFQSSHSNKKLRYVEFMTLQIRLNAIKNLHYIPSFSDVAYNFLQFITLWFMPVKIRMNLFNFIRNNIYK